MQRVVIVGAAGAGKTTLADALAGELRAARIELDGLRWAPHWTAVSDESFRERVRLAASAERWVADGDYAAVRDLLWQRADTLIWLDYPLWLSFGRLVPRTVGRALRREALWSGNREQLRFHLGNRDSLFLQALRSYPKLRRAYPALLRQSRYAHVRLVRLRLPKQTANWLLRAVPR